MSGIERRLAELRVRAEKGDRSAKRELRSLARRTRAPQSAPDEIRERLGRVKGSTARRVEVPTLDDAERLVRRLSEVGVTARARTFRRPLRLEVTSPDPDTTATYVVEIQEGDLLARIGGGLLAPTTPDGSDLVGRLDRGPWAPSSDESGRRVPAWKRPLWAILRPTHGEELSLEQARRLEATEVCPHCGRREGKGYRRYLYVVRRPDGRFEALGSTCGADAFGVSLAGLWPTRKIEAATEELLGAFMAEVEAERRREERNAVWEQAAGCLTEALWAEAEARGIDPYAHDEAGLTVEDILEALDKHVETHQLSEGFEANTAARLVNDPARFHAHGTLNRWGRALLDWYLRSLSAPAAGPGPFPYAAGDTVKLTATVLRSTRKRSDWGGTYLGVTLRTDAGHRVWVATSKESFGVEGRRLVFMAKVKDVKRSHGAQEGIAFLRAPRLVAILDEDEQVA